jgi:hypothetical protein
MLALGGPSRVALGSEEDLSLYWNCCSNGPVQQSHLNQRMWQLQSTWLSNVAYDTAPLHKPAPLENDSASDSNFSEEEAQCN